MSAQNYVSVDDQLETGETLADDDIIALVTSSEDSDDDEEDKPQTRRVPSLAQAREAVSVLQLFFEARGHGVGCKLMLDTGKTLDELSTKETVQTPLESYFTTQMNFLYTVYTICTMTCLYFGCEYIISIVFTQCYYYHGNIIMMHSEMFSARTSQTLNLINPP